MRKIAIFFDGTWNDVTHAVQPTNVKKLKDLMALKYGTDYEADALYLEGPGTRPGTTLPGGAFASDLDDIIQEAYIWLVNKWCVIGDKDAPPEIYLFGFSRGAYLAHTFSWFLQETGVIDGSEKAKIPAVVKRFMSHSPLGGRLARPATAIPSIRMLGLWDVVSAPLDIYKHYHDGEVAPNVQRVYHAMSLDETRGLFPVLKYKVNPGKVHQRWFSGVHSDVGGGYPDCTLSDITLEWMADNATEEGLFIKPTSTKEPDFQHMTIHDENANGERTPRKYEMEPIDSSVYSRLASGTGYHPQAADFPALPESFA